MAQFGIDRSYYWRRTREYINRELVNDLFPYNDDEWVEFSAGLFGLRYFDRIHYSLRYTHGIKEKYGFWAEVTYYRRRQDGLGIDTRDRIDEWDVDKFCKLVQEVNGSWSLCKFNLLDREDLLAELAQEKIAAEWKEC